MTEEKKSDYINITEDGGVKKKIIKEGNGEQAAEGKKVHVFYVGRNKDNKIFDQTKDKPFTFKIGEHQVIKGWEIGVATMKVGEKSEFILSPDYAYGNRKISDLIPENSTLTFEIELKEITEMTYDEKLNEGKKMKAKGVEKYKAGDFETAKNFFQRAISYLENMDPNKKEEEEGVTLYTTILSNLCNCCNKLKEYYKVINFASKGIKIKRLPKFFYFRSLAYANNSKFDQATEDLESLKGLLTDKEKESDEGIKYVTNVIENCKIEVYKNRKKFSKGLFSPLHDEGKILPAKPFDPPKEPNKDNPQVFLDIKIGEKEPQRIEIELFKDKVPKTAENFRCLCTGEKGEKLYYKGSIFHKVIRNFIIQGGDIENGNGTGGSSIYGKTFEDENFFYAHSREGLLSMANSGEDSNGSQFFFTLIDAPWLNGKHVVFGQIIKGIEVIKEVEVLETDEEDRPKTTITIVNCGEIKKEKKNEEIGAEEVKA